MKLADERGLFLLVQPSGGKLWRMKYRVAGKEKKLSLGRYPDVTLREARKRSAEARELLAAGTDPSEKKRLDRLHAALEAATTFAAVANEYIDKSDREGRAAVTVDKARWLLSLSWNRRWVTGPSKRSARPSCLQRYGGSKLAVTSRPLSACARSPVACSGMRLQLRVRRPIRLRHCAER